MLACSDMSQVIYARVSDSLKEAVDAYAVDRAVTLTSAAVDLLERGLAAASDERSVANLETTVARVTAKKESVEARLSAAEGELTTMRVIGERSAKTTVGVCPNKACASPISGYDLLATGHCRQCGTSLAGLLAPSRASNGLNQMEVGVLLGAIGVALIGIGVTGMAGK